MNTIMLTLRDVSDEASGKRYGAWIRTNLQGCPEIARLRLIAGRLAYGPDVPSTG